MAGCCARVGSVVCRVDGGDQPTGPEPRRTDAVCDVPAASVHATVTVSPGWCVARTSTSCSDEATVRPSTAVTTAPVAIPARSAADPGTTSAPGTPPDEPAADPARATCTPRKAVVPM